MKILLIILSIVGLLKLVSLFLQLVILSIKNNIKKVVNSRCEKHYHEINNSLSCGICDWLYLIPTIKTTVSSKYFEVELDILVFYVFVSYKIVDVDEEK